MSGYPGWEPLKSWENRDRKFFRKICKANLTSCPNNHTLRIVGYLRAYIWKGQKNEPNAENVVDDGDMYQHRIDPECNGHHNSLF